MSRFAESVRAAVTARAGDRCEYCRLPTRGQVATFPIDHIVPQSIGGTDALDNLAMACPHCNAFKWAYSEGTDPASGVPTRLFHPRTDAWEDHFAWSAQDWGILEGKTPVGRATIERLQMNAPQLIATRRLLAALGVVPDAAG